ncbi:protein OSB1, mitochondrial-like isoform X2 [Malania oleifera]|uniref:protein OSB1, mitochondrial-like isoform X2 n=1 Tax=Malania oleifera TaxID=397392 RepID=UPI0025ADBD2A|nr:protein OSB1, mitochondrial-like isoform X2 [Malania oleifera]
MALKHTLVLRNLFLASESTHTSSSSPFPNPISSLRFLTSPSQPKIKRLGFNRSVEYNGHHHEQSVYPKPSEIPWKKELCNAVHLIGIVGTPVQLKHLSSGKVLAWTRLGFKKSATDTIWINLTFWDELAQVAFQHVEKGNQIYVFGRLVSDTVENDDGKQQIYYKVVVQQLNFVERSLSSAATYDRDPSSMTAGRKLSNVAASSTGSTEELWQAFFANPVDWWDNRKSKRNPKYPDFKHKDTGEALWIEGKYNPPWVKSQLAILDSRMEPLHDQDARMHVTSIAGDEFMPF